MNIKRNCIFLLDKEKDKTDAKLRYRIKWEITPSRLMWDTGWT